MTQWIVFNAIVLLVLALDLFVFHKKAHVVSFKEAMIWSAVWIFLALSFNVYIYFAMGQDAALNFLAGYVVEKSLSVDNLFVFILIFSYFQTPDSSLHKVLFWGILGAIVTRALFILLGVTLVRHFHAIVYIFGVFLVITGIRFIYQKTEKIHPEKNFLLKISNYLIPVDKEYHEDRFFVKKHGRIFATPLWLVLLCIEATDIVFAVDSIPAILAITYDPFIVYTSNIFAILGLRSLFFLLSNSLKLFHYLHYGIALILIFVGVKMLFTDVWKISPLFALLVVMAILSLSILISILFKKKDHSRNR